MSVEMIVDGRVRVRDSRVLVGRLGVSEILIRSLGVQDDDLRVRVKGETVFDTRFHVGWYQGETFLTSSVPPFPDVESASAWRIARISESDLAKIGGAIAGDLVEVDVFDGWGGSWRTAPWVAEVTWMDGRRTVYTGGTARSGASVQDATPGYFEIDLLADFPLRTDVPTGGLYGARSYGPYPFDAIVLSHADNPAWADDDLVLNGVTVYPTGVADYINGGATTELLVLRAGESFSVDIYNTGGWCWGQGALRIQQAYFSVGPHFLSYIANGSFVL